MDNPVREAQRAKEVQLDWVSELYDIVEVLRDRVHQYELRLKDVENRVTRTERELELGDDDDN